MADTVRPLISTAIIMATLWRNRLHDACTILTRMLPLEYDPLDPKGPGKSGQPIPLIFAISAPSSCHSPWGKDSCYMGTHWPDSLSDHNPYKPMVATFQMNVVPDERLFKYRLLLLVVMLTTGHPLFLITQTFMYAL